MTVDVDPTFTDAVDVVFDLVSVLFESSSNRCWDVCDDTIADVEAVEDFVNDDGAIAGVILTECVVDDKEDDDDGACRCRLGGEATGTSFDVAPLFVLLLLFVTFFASV